MVKDILHRFKKWARENYGISFVCLSSFLLLLYRAKDLMIGPYSWSNAFNAIVVQNYHEYGFFFSKFEPVVFNLAPYLKSFYLTHPPLFFIFIGAVFKITSSLLFVRLAVILCSVLSVYFLYRLVLNITKKKETALLSSIFMGLSPMLLYYGKLINFEAVVLGLIIVDCLLLISLRNNFTKKRLFLFIASLFITALFDWPVTFLVLIVSAYGFFFFKKKERIVVIASAVVPVIADISFLLFERNFFGLNNLVGAGKTRMTYTLLFSIDFWRLIIDRCISLFTPVVILLSIFFILGLVYKAVKEEKIKNLLPNEQFFWIIAFFYLGLINVLVFPNGAQVHEFWLYYFLPFFCMTAGLMVVKLGEKENIIAVLVVFLFFSLTTYRDVYRWASGQQDGINKVVSYFHSNNIGSEYLFIGSPPLVSEADNETNVSAVYWPDFASQLDKFKQLENEKKYLGVYISYDIYGTKESLENIFSTAFGSENVTFEYLDSVGLVKVDLVPR